MNTKDEIINYITSINTDNRVVIFNVVLSGYGVHYFIGYLYGDKEYGCGILQYYGDIIRWSRNKNIDYFSTFDTTVMQ
jgi:hypothetical protein